MSKLGRGDNPCPYIIASMKMKEDGKTLPPKEYEYNVGIAPLDVRNNVMTLSKVDNYSYKEIDGEVYRVHNKSGKVYGPPITKAQFEELQRLHEENFGKDKEDGMEH